MNKIILTKYIAVDGTEFDDEIDCKAYEDEIKKSDKIILDNIYFFDKNGDVIPYSSIDENSQISINNVFYIYYGNVDFIEIRDYIDKLASECIMPMLINNSLYFYEQDDNWIDLSKRIKIHNKVLKYLSDNNLKVDEV